MHVLKLTKITPKSKTRDRDNLDTLTNSENEVNSECESVSDEVSSERNEDESSINEISVQIEEEEK